MKKIKIVPIVLMFLVLAFITSCKKSNINDYPDFVGTWNATQVTTDYEVIIKTDGKATYEKVSDNTSVFFKGKFIVKDDELKIGLKKLKISKSPELSTTDNLWHMTLDGIEYSRF